MMSELKPCPFCGDFATQSIRMPLHGEQVKYKIMCSSCCAQTAEKHDPANAIKAWNRRYEPDSEIDFDYEAEDD